MLFDTHCHLVHKKYKKPSEEVIKNAEEAGVDLFLHVGTSLKENEQAIELAEKRDNVFCGLGIYPHEDRDVSLAELEKSLRGQIKKSKKVVAIGETGIDSPSLKASDEQSISGRERPLKDQIELFEMQAKMAIEFSLPLIIHNRNGDEQVLALVRKHSSDGLIGACHCFVQDWSYAQKMLDFGFYLGFGGIITYPPSPEATEGQSDSAAKTSDVRSILEVIKNCPKDRILIETDAPYLAPGNLRGNVNEPKNIVITAQKIAETRGISYDEVCKLTYENGKRLFRIDAFNKFGIN